MKRKLLTLMLIMSLAVANVGCGGDKGTDNNTTSTPAPTTTVQDSNTNENQNNDTQNDTDNNESKPEDNTENNEGSNSESSYADATAALTAIWDKVDEDMKFPCFGGSIENAVMDAPGAIALDDVNTMTSTLIIPEAMQANIKSAASLMHMMNANTFTGAAIKVDGMDVAAVADAMKESFLGTHFMCGIPDKLTVASLDGYVVYAFGAEDAVDSFMAKAVELGGTVLVEQAFELDF